MQGRRQHVSISSAASQQNKHHVETFAAVLQAGVSPDQRRSVGGPTRRFWILGPTVFDTSSAVLQAEVPTTKTVSSEYVDRVAK